MSALLRPFGISSMIIKMRLFILALIGATLQNPASTGKPPYEVCDILQNIQKYQGKVIEVRGEWAVGYAVLGNCPISLKAGDQTWVNGIALDTPESVNGEINTLSDTSDGPTWNLDRNAWAAADDIGFRLVSANGPDTKLFATFVGRLDVVAKLLGKPETVDPPERSGFGHLNSYPARLVLITVRDVGLSKRE